MDKGSIVYTVSKEEAEYYIGKNTVIHDLERRTLLSDFIDVHGHLVSSAGMKGITNLSPSTY